MTGVHWESHRLCSSCRGRTGCLVWWPFTTIVVLPISMTCSHVRYLWSVKSLWICEKTRISKKKEKKKRDLIGLTSEITDDVSVGRRDDHLQLCPQMASGEHFAPLQDDPGSKRPLGIKSVNLNAHMQYNRGKRSSLFANDGLNNYWRMTTGHRVMLHMRGDTICGLIPTHEAR